MGTCLPAPSLHRSTQAPLTIGQLARRFGDDLRATTALTPAQHRVLVALQRCRTAALGGHLEQCTACGSSHLFYHSCRNRHCPTCQSFAQRQWILHRSTRLLPVPHFHVVFTLPAPLRPVALAHSTAIYDLLFQAASATLLTFGKDPTHLGAQLGITAVLHTWTRALLFHPHLHCLVTAGGLSSDGARWIAGSARFLFPVRALSAVFRGKFIDGLKALFQRKRLPSLTTSTLAQLLAALRAQPWVVYSKAPFGGPRALFSYLGRYTHRTGISNQRLVSFDDQSVVFRTRGGKRCTLTPVEFLRRFLLHVLPPRFVKIRHFGLLAAANVNGRLASAQRLLAPRAPTPVPAASTPVPAASTPVPAAPDPAGSEPAQALHRLPLCPRCKVGFLVPIASLGAFALSLCHFFASLAALVSDTS